MTNNYVFFCISLILQLQYQWIFLGKLETFRNKSAPSFIIGRESRGGYQWRKWVGSTGQKCGPLSLFTTSPLFCNKRVYSAGWITHTFHTSFQPERASCVRESPCYPECSQNILQKQSCTQWISEMTASHHILVIHCYKEQLRSSSINEHQCTCICKVMLSLLP